MAAFDPATLERWRALAIVDRDGGTVGTISEFYLDRETGHPTWALVSTGVFGTTQSFVPLVHATEISDGLQVPYEKRHIRDSPRVDLHDELTPEEEAALFAHYGVDYEPAPGPPAVEDPAAATPAVTVAGEPGPGEPPGPVAADPATAAVVGVADAARDPGDTPEVPPEPVSTDPTAVAEGEGGSVPADATEALPVPHEPAESDGGHPAPDADTTTAGVPDEPRTTPASDPARVDEDGIGPEGATQAEAGSGADEGSTVESGWEAEAESGAAGPDNPVDPGSDPDRLQDTRTGAGPAQSAQAQFAQTDPNPDHLRSAPDDPGPDQLRRGPEDPGPDQRHDRSADADQLRGGLPGTDQLPNGPADPDLDRNAPVEPGLAGPTAASPYGAPATVDMGDGPSGHPADGPIRAPAEAGWAPGAAGSFEEHDPVDPPAATSDRWREAKLAAERDRIARAAAAQPEDRSPLERARRRLERLVGVGQEPADDDETSPADREAAERARRARLGLDEEDHRQR